MTPLRQPRVSISSGGTHAAASTTSSCQAQRQRPGERRRRQCAPHMAAHLLQRGTASSRAAMTRARCLVSAASSPQWRCHWYAGRRANWAPNLVKRRVVLHRGGPGPGVRRRSRDLVLGLRRSSITPLPWDARSGNSGSAQSAGRRRRCPIAQPVPFAAHGLHCQGPLKTS